MSRIGKRYFLILWPRIAHEAVEALQVDWLILIIDSPDSLASKDLLALIIGLVGVF